VLPDCPALLFFFSLLLIVIYCGQMMMMMMKLTGSYATGSCDANMHDRVTALLSVLGRHIDYGIRLISSSRLNWCIKLIRPIRRQMDGGSCSSSWSFLELK